MPLSHYIILDLVTIISGEQYKLRSPSLCNFSISISSPLGPNILSNVLQMPPGNLLLWKL